MSDSIDPQKENRLMALINKVPFILQVVSGMVLGVIFAIILPNGQPVITMLGDLFVDALKAIAPFLVLALVMSSIALQKKGIDAKVKPIILLFVVSMLGATFVSLILTDIFPSTFAVVADKVEATPPQNLASVLTSVIRRAVDNPASALVNGNYIAILFWGIVFGVICRSASYKVKDGLQGFTEIIGRGVVFVIKFVPIGVFGLVYTACTIDGGFKNLLGYAHVLGVSIVASIIIVLVLNPIIIFALTRRNPYPLIFACITHSGITAFFTRSSVANIPINMQLCERLGIPKESYSISIPLGSTINMSGSTVIIVTLTMAAVHTLGIQVDLGSSILLCVVAVLCACGTSGIADGSLMLLPLSCSLFGIQNDVAMQVVAIGFIIGVIQDGFATALNSSSDVLFTAVANKITDVDFKKLK